MVFTANQVTAFFEDAAQMGLDHRTRVFLQGEGIVTPEDLAEFAEEDSWKQLLENCKRPPQIPDGAGNLVDQQPFRLGSKSLRRMKTAALAIKHFIEVGRNIEAHMVMWTPRLANFETEWKAILELKDNPPTNKMPDISKKHPIDRFTEAYPTYLSGLISGLMCSYGRIVREEEAVAMPSPPLAQGQPFAAEYGSILEERNARIPFTHALSEMDNRKVFKDLQEATRGTQYAPALAPFKRTQDGRGAFLALKAQFCGAALWDTKQKDCETALQTRTYDGGKGGVSLPQFLSSHRAWYEGLVRCSEHNGCQLPNERTRVKYVIDGIVTDNSKLRAAVAAITTDDGPGGKRNDFEACVAFLLQHDPANDGKKSTKRTAAEISASEGSTDDKDESKPSAGKKKPARGKTGVEFRYYTRREYNNLTKAQQAELREYRREHGRFDGQKTFRKKGEGKRAYTKAQIAAFVKEEADKREKEREDKEAKAKAAEAIYAKGIIAAARSLTAGKGQKSEVSAAAGAQKAKAKAKVTFTEPDEGDDVDMHAAQVAAQELMALHRGLAP